jgi:hypothetical protein
MSESHSPEWVVRRFLASRADFNVDEAFAFFDDDACLSTLRGECTAG